MEIKAILSPALPRKFRMRIAFVGTEFTGFQSQKTGLSIQEVLESTLSKITQERIKVVGCSRTDSGVHARGFVAHFETRAQIAVRGLQLGANSILPKSISILDLQECSMDFHARKHALAKLYRYQIFNTGVRDPFLYPFSWQLDRPLHLEAMQQASGDFVGTQDFSSFRAADKAPRNPIRTIESCVLYVSPQDPRLLVIDILGKSFLKYMVRNIVGTLVEIGKGLRPASCIPELFAAKDRSQAGRTAPAQGLTLMQVYYPPSESIVGQALANGQRNTVL